VADTIFTRALAQAAAVQGSNQALAYQLHVPENTLLRWMSGRAQMPLRAFHRVIELLVEHEKSPGAQPQAPAAAPVEELGFNIGELLARCARCGGTQFAPATPQTALKMTGTLLCCSCRFTVTRGELLAELAAEAVRHTRAMTTFRKPPANAKVIRLARR
jgi:hypothetical protein